MTPLIIGRDGQLRRDQRGGKGYWGVYRIGTTLSQITQSEF